MTDDIKKLIAELRNEKWEAEALARKVHTQLYKKAADAIEAEHQRAEDLRSVVDRTWISDYSSLQVENVRVARERDALRAAIQTGHIHVRGVLEKLDSYSWHANDSGFVTSTRMSAFSAFDILSRAIDTKEKTDES